MTMGIKRIDVIAVVLILLGALNWGLVGLFRVDLVAAVFGTTLLSTVLYVMIGLAGVFEVVQWQAIKRRWGILS